MNMYQLNKSGTRFIKTSVPLVAPFGKHRVAFPLPDEEEDVESDYAFWDEEVERNHQQAFPFLLYQLSLPMDCLVTVSWWKKENEELELIDEDVIDATSKDWRIWRFTAMRVIFHSLSRYAMFEMIATLNEEKGYPAKPPIYLASLMP